MRYSFTRREILKHVPAGLATTVASAAVLSVADDAPKDKPAERTPGEPFVYCFNTSTIRGQKLSLVDELELIAKVGYRGVEPWIFEIQAYKEGGRPLADLKKRIADLGLTVESAIGFAPWIVDDDAQRAKGLEQAKREMDLVEKIGGRRLAAPPAGATDKPGLDLRKAAERYRALLEAGEKIGVVPQLEVWGFSKNLGKLSEAVFVALETGRKDACVLPDVYHLYKGGSPLSGVRLLSGASMHVFHFNDYPADPPRERIRDADRVFPGDGVAPLTDLLRTLHANGYRGALSLELFNAGYYKQDAKAVAQTGLDKMRLAVRKALHG